MHAFLYLYILLFYICAKIFKFSTDSIHFPLLESPCNNTTDIPNWKLDDYSVLTQKELGNHLLTFLCQRCGQKLIWCNEIFPTKSFVLWKLFHMWLPMICKRKREIWFCVLCVKNVSLSNIFCYCSTMCYGPDCLVLFLPFGVVLLLSFKFFVTFLVQ